MLFSVWKFMNFNLCKVEHNKVLGVNGKIAIKKKLWKIVLHFSFKSPSLNDKILRTHVLNLFYILMIHELEH